MTHAFALSRLQSIWSFLSMAMHVLLLIAALQDHNIQSFDTPIPTIDAEFIEISLAEKYPPPTQQQEEAIQQPENTPPAISETTSQKEASAKEAIVIKVRNKTPYRNKSTPKTLISPAQQKDIYEEKLSRHFLYYVGHISHQERNQIKIWVKLDAQGYIHEHGFIANHLSRKLQKQLEVALKKANPMPKPEKIHLGEMVTYVIPVLWD